MTTWRWQRRFTLLTVSATVIIILFCLRVVNLENWSLKCPQPKISTTDYHATAIIPSFCVETSRCKHLYTNASRHFSFIHISKCAGSSWRRELTNLEVDIFPPRFGEDTVQYQDNKDASSFTSYSLVSFKSPRHHVWSLFTECMYDTWGMQVTKKTNFPRNSSNDEENFDEWLNHFINATHQQYPAGVDRYNCYHPANYQSQYLATDYSAGQSHGYKSNRVPLASFEPEWNRVRNAYYDFDWVALADFYHESKCLLYYRLTPKTDTIEEYLETTCRCDIDDSATINTTTSDVRIQHHEHGHRLELRTLPESTLQKIAILTRIDVKLYIEALYQFMQEVVWLERKLNRQVLCNGALSIKEDELTYLNVSVTQLYQQAK